MTYRSQLGEALHHPPQRLGLLLEACNQRIGNQTQQEPKQNSSNRNDSTTHHKSNQITPTFSNHHVNPKIGQPKEKSGTMTQGPPTRNLRCIRKTHLAIMSTTQGKEQAILPCQHVPKKTCTYQATTKQGQNTTHFQQELESWGKTIPKFPRMLSCHTWSFWNPLKLTPRTKRMTFHKQNLCTPKENSPLKPPSVGAPCLFKVQKLNYN